MVLARAQWLRRGRQSSSGYCGPSRERMEKPRGNRKERMYVSFIVSASKQYKKTTLDEFVQSLRRSDPIRAEERRAWRLMGTCVALSHHVELDTHPSVAFSIVQMHIKPARTCAVGKMDVHPAVARGYPSPRAGRDNGQESWKHRFSVPFVRISKMICVHTLAQAILHHMFSLHYHVLHFNQQILQPHLKIPLIGGTVFILRCCCMREGHCAFRRMYLAPGANHK